MSDDTNTTTTTETLEHPPALLLVITWDQGVKHLSDTQKEHLLNPDGCTQCKLFLKRVGRVRCPGRFARQAIDTYPLTSALGQAFEEHLDTCKLYCGEDYAKSREHPLHVDVVAIALYGPKSKHFVQADRDHLLGTSCAQCESLIDQALALQCPEVLWINWSSLPSEDSILGRSLRKHVQTCDNPHCKSTAERVAEWDIIPRSPTR